MPNAFSVDPFVPNSYPRVVAARPTLGKVRNFLINPARVIPRMPNAFSVDPYVPNSYPRVVATRQPWAGISQRLRS